MGNARPAPIAIIAKTAQKTKELVAFAGNGNYKRAKMIFSPFLFTRSKRNIYLKNTLIIKN
ncbi:hypothetical protein EDM00_00895 [Ornithobacterium rhinotracheale]|nr:hypothetical protein [Ornithobacterium rhinotracheale]